MLSISRKVRVGVIGAGRIGRTHLENLAHKVIKVELAAVSEIAFAEAEKCAKEHAIPVAVRDYRAQLENRDIEAILICSSSDTHAWIVEEAAGRRKDIFCEKPVAFDLAVIDRALAAVKKAGVKPQVGFNRRFDANNANVAEIA